LSEALLVTLIVLSSFFASRVNLCEIANLSLISGAGKVGYWKMKNKIMKFVPLLLLLASLEGYCFEVAQTLRLFRRLPTLPANL